MTAKLQLPFPTREIIDNARREPRDYADALAVLASVRVRGRTQTYDVVRAEAEPLWKFKEWLSRLGYRPSDLDKLSAIHLTGSKGKGSIAAYTSSILTGIAPNAKIGRYTSPQLVYDRERISINGEPISEELFAKYFFELWDRLMATNSSWEPDSYARPSYFWILTLLAFHVFLCEKVDIAIIEVGAGGYADCTNILQKPLVSAIGSIGLAHVGEIGNNTTEIAQDKSGIFKDGCPALTLVQEEYSVMQALASAAHERGVSSYTLVSRLKWLEKLDIGLAGPHQVTNASLALYIVQAALSSPRCPPAFKQAAKELQDPRYREPMIVQPAQPMPWYAQVDFHGLRLVAQHPRLALNAAILFAIALYYAVQHCLVTYHAKGWNGLASMAPIYISGSLLASFTLWDKYHESRDRGYYSSEEYDRGYSRYADNEDAELPSIGLSPSLRCGKVYRALAATRWPGRAEVLKDPKSSAVMYLDCAHTPESCELASRWFATGSGCSPPTVTAEEPSSPESAGFVSIPAIVKQKRRKVLVFTLPDGVAAPFSLLERLLKGCSTMNAAGMQNIPFERVIIASDDVILRGDFAKDPNQTRQKDLFKLWEKMVPNSTTDLQAKPEEGKIRVSIASTVEDVREQVRAAAGEADAEEYGCDVFVTGSIYLVGYVYQLFELPLNFTAKA